MAVNLLSVRRASNRRAQPHAVHACAHRQQWRHPGRGPVKQGRPPAISVAVEPLFSRLSGAGARPGDVLSFNAELLPARIGEGADAMWLHYAPTLPHEPEDPLRANPATVTAMP